MAVLKANDNKKKVGTNNQQKITMLKNQWTDWNLIIKENVF